MNDYKSFHKRSIENPQSFWKEQAQSIDWCTFPTKILSKDADGFDRPTVFVPNVFSPNGDGTNDHLDVFIDVVLPIRDYQTSVL